METTAKANTTTKSFLPLTKEAAGQVTIEVLKLVLDKIRVPEPDGKVRANTTTTMSDGEVGYYTAKEYACEHVIPEKLLERFTDDAVREKAQSLILAILCYDTKGATAKAKELGKENMKLLIEAVDALSLSARVPVEKVGKEDLPGFECVKEGDLIGMDIIASAVSPIASGLRKAGAEASA